MKSKILTVIAALAVVAGVTSCQENEYGTVDLTPNNTEKAVEGIYTYNHPCAMYCQSDFDRVKTALNDGTAPATVKQEFENLKNSSYTSKNYTPNPTDEIVRGDASGTATGSENYSNAMRDGAAAYQMAILWKLTGDDDYAAAVVRILNAWAAKCKRVTSNDSNHMLAAGAQGYTFANAAEIVRTYSGWDAADFATFKTWMLNVFAERNLNFLTNHQGTCDLHYWSNWDLLALSSYLSIGILTENNDMVNVVVNYFKSGVGNGCIKNLITAYHDDPLGTGETLGQNQESGRDQGHANMSAMVASNLAQIAYTLYRSNPEIPDLDFFSVNDNALLKMAEYVALTNLRTGTDRSNADGLWLLNADRIPFTTYNYCVDCTCKNNSHSWVQTEFADGGARGSARPGWEIYYTHYAKVKNLGSGFTYVKRMADKLRPEGGVGEAENRYGSNSGAFDQLGWSTLMLYTE